MSGWPRTKHVCLRREVGVIHSGWVTFQILTENGHRPPTTVGVRKLECCRFVWYQNIRNASFSLVAIHAYDRRTELQQHTVCCTACSRTVKLKKQPSKFTLPKTIVITIKLQIHANVLYAYTLLLALPSCFSDVRLSYQLQITLNKIRTANYRQISTADQLPTLGKNETEQYSAVSDLGKD